MRSAPEPGLSREPFCGLCERIASANPLLANEAKKIERAVRVQGFVTPSQWKAIDGLRRTVERRRRRQKGA